jgi:hypothetical protein
MDFLKPKKKTVSIDKIYTNSKNGQMTILLPKKKFKTTPKKVEVTGIW